VNRRHRARRGERDTDEQMPLWSRGMAITLDQRVRGGVSYRNPVDVDRQHLLLQFAEVLFHSDVGIAQPPMHYHPSLIELERSVVE